MNTEKLYDMSFLQKVSGGDEDFILEMIQTFREVGPEYIEKAQSLLAKGDYSALSKETHRIIPGVSFLGAKSLEKYLMHIEENTKKMINMEDVPSLVEKSCTIIVQLIDELETDF